MHSTPDDPSVIHWTRLLASVLRDRDHPQHDAQIESAHHLALSTARAMGAGEDLADEVANIVAEIILERKLERLKDDHAVIGYVIKMARLTVLGMRRERIRERARKKRFARSCARCRPTEDASSLTILMGETEELARIWELSRGALSKRCWANKSLEELHAISKTCSTQADLARAHGVSPSRVTETFAVIRSAIREQLDD